MVRKLLEHRQYGLFIIANYLTVDSLSCSTINGGQRFANLRSGIDA